ncbi:hypothetical protein [Methylomonas sp. DH-1]|uniref:hypothetical protein n=1 Tax=Methylomonas sp. (strain DH-1) TaxID=1727196 RepID=UPI0007C98DF7|nr:hypothetical protein [Methylomonas sp. DH-1]ANE55702.1 hypothetical protein AYM39_11275 [Methylomonas sp. DH-1]
MNGIRVLSLTVCLLAGTACSADWAQRFAYHAVENAGQLQCQKAMADDCERRPGYDQYQKQRRELER